MQFIKIQETINKVKYKRLRNVYIKSVIQIRFVDF